MFGPMSEGTIDLVDSTGAIVGHGFIERVDGAGQRQRWVLGPKYISPPAAAVTMRRSARQFADVGEWIATVRSGLWRQGSRYVEGICVFKEEQIEIRDQLVGIYQNIAGKPQLVGLAVSTAAGLASANEAAVGCRTFSGAELVPVERLNEHWWMLPAFTPPPGGTIELRATSVKFEDLARRMPSYALVECTTFRECPEIEPRRVQPKHQ